MTIALIVAVAENGVIGRTGTMLPWHVRADLKRFKQLTTGSTIIMGRKTYETIGRALPDRQSIVVTRNPDYKAAGCKVVQSLERALEMAKGEERVFIIGGGELFKLGLPYAQELYLTRIHTEPEGDTFFTYNQSAWKEVSRTDYEADEQNDYPYSFIDLVKAE